MYIEPIEDDSLPCESDVCIEVENICILLEKTFTEENKFYISSSFFEMQAARPYMEDRTFISKDHKLCAVFDGHGGFQIADILFQSFEKILKLKLECCYGRHLHYTNEEIITGMNRTLIEIDKMVMADGSLGRMGSTATISYINIDPIDPKMSSIVTANIGDSRVVLSCGGQAVPLTMDHKPTNKLERHRIESLGGAVLFCKGQYRVMGNLAMSRAIGEERDMKQSYYSDYVSVRSSQVTRICDPMCRGTPSTTSTTWTEEEEEEEEEEEVQQQGTRRRGRGTYWDNRSSSSVGPIYCF
jgi:serine/threonine protein phosphatase PrpC